MTRTIRVLMDDHAKLMEIRKHRPQDATIADTFNYILRVFEESPVRIEICNELTKPNTIIAGSASPIIDNNLRIIMPVLVERGLARAAEELYNEKKRRDALRAANEAPTRNNLFKEDKE